LHAEQELAGRQLSDPFTLGVLEIVRFKAFVCFNLHPVCCKKERGQGEEKEKEKEEEEEEEVAVRRTWVMELQAAVSVLTTLCLSDGDCGGGAG
jgi:CO dehydrogenase/acetyl-CoA synthase beta subunit